MDILGILDTAVNRFCNVLNAALSGKNVISYTWRYGDTSWDYEIDLETMTQTNRTTGKVRAVVLSIVEIDTASTAMEAVRFVMSRRVPLTPDADDDAAM